MIEIQGLTERQYRLADMIWACDGQEDVARFIKGLPPEYRQDAETVHELMIAAVFDQDLEVLDEIKDLCHGFGR